MKKPVTLTLAAFALALVAGNASADMKKIKIATEGAYAPFNFVDANGELQGFDVDIAKALCEHMKIECEIVKQDWDGMIPALLAKKFDAIVASMSITDDRKKKVDFSDRYYLSAGKFVGKKGTTYDLSADGLAGKRVGVQRATIHEKYVHATWPKAEVVVYDTQENLNLDMVGGRLDLMMADKIALSEGFLKKEGKDDFEFVGPDYYDPKIHGYGSGVAVRKGEDELREAFNKAIAAIRQDGTYKAINARYFDFDIFGSPSS